MDGSSPNIYEALTLGGEVTIVLVVVWLLEGTEKRIIGRITEMINMLIQNNHFRNQDDRD